MKILRYLKPGPAIALCGVLLLASFAVLYGIASVHAAHRYRDLRARYCAHLVATHNARNPRIQVLTLLDPCVAWEQISGEVMR